MTSAQDYNKLIDTSNYWDIAYAQMDYLCNRFSEFPPKRYSFQGDTIINDKHYSKVYYNELLPLWPPFNCSPFNVDTNLYHDQYKYMREDTIEKKVWYLYIPNEEEGLLYDFSLEQGDTLYHNWLYPTIIDSVYPIVTNDGITRNKFEISVSDAWGSGYYIEGIGGVAGIFYQPFYYFESGHWLMCVKDNHEEIIYSEDSYDCYNYITGISDSFIGYDIVVSPNPFIASTTLLYKLKEPSTVQLSVFNQLGQLVYAYSEKQQQGDQQLIWDASKQPEGLYFFRLKAGDQVATGKMVKVK
jgi:hypothetical protein